MAVVVTFDAQPGGRSTMFPRKVRRGTISLGAYATGGVPVTPAMVGLVRIDDLDIQNASGYSPEWLPGAAPKVKVSYDNAGAAYTQNQPQGEVANAANLAAFNFRFRAEGA